MQKQNIFHTAVLAALLSSALILAWPNIGWADSCNSEISGSWSDPSIWDCWHVPFDGDTVQIGNSMTVDLDTDVTVNILYFRGTLNAGSYTINVNRFYGYGTFNAGTGKVVVRGLDPPPDVRIWTLSGKITFNNLEMAPVTAPSVIMIGYRTSPNNFQHGIITVNGTFISGSSAANTVSFAKMGLQSNVTNPVTSYYCADNGGITNITCLPGGPFPTVTSVNSATDGSYKSGDIISVTVTFSEAVTVTGTPQLTLETGTTDAVADYVSGSGSDGLVFSYTVAAGHTSADLDYEATDSLVLNGGTIKNGSGDDVDLILPAPGATDSLSANRDIKIDTAAPAVALSGAASDPTNSSPFTVTVTFNEYVTGFDVGDISVTNGTAGNLAVTTANRVWTADITPSSDGAVYVDISADVAQDAAGNGSTAATQLSRTYDGTAPSVTINQAAAQTDPATSPPVNFTVVFSEAVTGFATGDVTLTGTAGAATGTVTGSGTTYNVAVTGMTSAGTVIADIASAKAADAAGNGNAASTSTDNQVTFTPPPPSVSSINRTGTTPTNAASVQFTVTFSESVSGIDTGDFTLALTGTAAGAIASVSAASGTTVTVTVNTVSGDGTLGLNLTDNDSIVNGMSVPLGGAGAGNGNFTGQTYTIDKTAPTVTVNQASGQDDPANSTPVNFTVVFSESVTGFATGDVSLSGTASPATGTVTEIAPNDGTTYNVAVTGMTSAGTVIADIASAKAADAAGNGNAASTSTDNQVDFTPPPPSVSSIDRTGTTPTNAASVQFTVTFSESVSGIDTGDFSLAATGTAAGAVASVSAAAGTTVTVTVNTVSGDGTLGLNLTDDDSIVRMSVPLGGAGAGNGNFTGQTYTVDNTGPSVSVSQASGQGDPTNASPVRFAVNFNESVTGFDNSDIDLSDSTAPGTLAATVTGTGASYTAEISGMTGAGDVTVKIPASAAQDAVGNVSAASAGGDSTVRYDPAYIPNVPPTDISLSGSTVAENQPAGTVVGSLSAADPDGGTHTFYLVVHPTLGWGENSYFQIDGTSLKTAAAFDAEAKSTYTVYIRANDSYGASCFKAFVIGVTDANESPTGLVLSYRWADEKLPAGTAVGTFTALGDPDAGETFAYSLISGDGSDDNGAFAVEGNTLKTSAVFDYNVKNTYRIRAKASDKGGLSAESAFVISVNDVNEAPTDITLNKSSVDENQPVSSVVGTFSGEDPNPWDTLAFSLLPGEGNTYFYIHDGNILKTRQPFDYETRKTYGVGVLADDGRGGTFEKNFTVTVNDVNDAPVISEIEDTEIQGAGNAGSAIADFTVSDPDTAAEKLTLSGKSSNPNLLPLSGIVFTGTGTDRTVTLTPVSGKSGSAEVTVTVSDGELTAETAFTLTVTVLPAPVFDDISVKPTTPDSAVAPGATLSFTAIIPNTGNADALGTVFTLPIPSNTAFVPGSAAIRFTDIETGKTVVLPGVSLPEYDGTENRLVWEGDIPAGLQAEIVSDVIADADLQTGDVISAEGWTFAYDSDGDGVNDVTVKPGSGSSGSSGGVTVIVPAPECMKGNADGDGDITLADAVTVLQILTGTETADAPALCADVNGDGKIGVAELLVILRKLAE